jgi:outer membrane protein OmpA-like peptidoglycan-associated protein
MALAVLAGGSHAQTGAPAPSAQQMIEQLQAPAAPRTRSLRNLSVEAAAPRPSLSLLIQFDYDSSRVRPESQQALANLAQALQSRELESSRFAIEGHTDAKGSAAYNQRLSQQRADAVRDFLGARRIDPARLDAVGKGASELANPAAPLAAENRRVRIVNLD